MYCFLFATPLGNFFQDAIGLPGKKSISSPVLFMVMASLVSKYITTLVWPDCCSVFFCLYMPSCVICGVSYK